MFADVLSTSMNVDELCSCVCACSMELNLAGIGNDLFENVSKNQNLCRNPAGISRNNHEIQRDM